MTPTAKRNTTHKLRSMDFDFRLASPAPAASSKVGAPTPSSGPLSPWCPRQLCSRQPGSPGEGFTYIFYHIICNMKNILNILQKRINLKQGNARLGDRNGEGDDSHDVEEVERPASEVGQVQTEKMSR